MSHETEASLHPPANASASPTTQLRYPTRHALLIGIDFYFRGSSRLSPSGTPIHYPFLRGCVNDVEKIAEVLPGLFANEGGCNIRVLRASVRENRDDKLPKEEDKSIWPTHDNIVKAFNDLEHNIQDGDLVYVHYSGHGIRRKRVRATGDGDTEIGTALVPADVSLGGSYITGYQLGIMVRSLMAGRQNVRVAVVLDSCFSGAGVRKFDDKTYMAERTLEGGYDETKLESDNRFEVECEDADKAMEAEEDVDYEGHRGVTRNRTPLTEVDGCIVLTACGIDEKALEYQFSSNGKTAVHGILTHWMLHGLGQHNSKKRATYARLKTHVARKIKTMGLGVLTQTPVLYGDEYYEFFSHRIQYERPRCPILARTDSQLTLGIGKAEGVFNGAIYNICPDLEDHSAVHGESEKDKSSDVILIGRVCIKNALEFQADAILLYGEAPDAIHDGNLAELNAVLHMWSLRNAQIDVDDIVANPKADMLGKEFKRKLHSLPGLCLSSDGNKINTDVKLSVDEDRCFKIKDSHGKGIGRIPRIPITDDLATEKLGYILRHLARYQDIKNLQNIEASSILSSTLMTFELLDKNRKPVPRSQSGRYEVKEEQEFVISFVSRLSKPVYVTFICLNATWGIERLHPSDNRNGEKTTSTYPVQYDLSMYIPARTSPDDSLEIDEILRACVCCQDGPGGSDELDEPPTWDGLMLPDLPASHSELPGSCAIEESLLPSWKKRHVKRVNSIKSPKWLFLNIEIRTSPALQT